MMKKVRCAIYTRKSSEEGLEQDFNSLDAQREACAAYVLSQASEGWQLLPEHYNDGGLSGGTLARPALQRLLADVAAGSVDIIVVYKVDRLTRSLLDFAKLVEALDKAEVSFVSVTQSFNTTTSMGRLTLNMLLSFAQFEREVTAERIRDKLAASKAKGMWMGGTPPLGYRPDGRSLAIVEPEAALIRDIYGRYLSLGSVTRLAAALYRGDIRVPRRARLSGATFGGGGFTRGQLYSLLKNPIYTGHIAHKGKLYDGLHRAIIEQNVWDAAQRLLAGNVTGGRRHGRPGTAERVSFLAGRLVDGLGAPLVASHASKPAKASEGDDSASAQSRVRYRYYSSRPHEPGTGSNRPAVRIPAREIEQVVVQHTAALLDDPLALIERAGLMLADCDLADLLQHAGEAQAELRRSDRTAFLELVTQVQLTGSGIMLSLSIEVIARLLALAVPAKPRAALVVPIDVLLKRTGRAMRLIQSNGAAPAGGSANSLLRLVIKARGWWEILKRGETDISGLAAQENVQAAYITRVLRLAFLSPAMVEAVLAGTLRAEVDGLTLTATGAIPACWNEQARRYLPGNHKTQEPGWSTLTMCE